MNIEQIKSLARALLCDVEHPTMQDIEDKAKLIKATLQLDVPTIDLVNIIASDLNIYQPASTYIVDDDEGANWLKEFRANGNCDWKFWTDYKKDLTLPAAAISEIDNSTERILDKLADPHMPGNWFRSGLVVGHVQSGKTGNFIGLVNKAMDVGYKIILILTGMYSDLRMQTQKRIDKGAIGKITDPQSIKSGQAIGVGKYAGHPNVINMTSSSMKGDFGSLLVNVGGVLKSSSPTILVCKKNSSILTNIIRSFAQEASIAADGLPIVDNIPLLIVDDEADSASINTQYNHGEITQINAKIRTILSLFSKRAYVGYTATPYANIFIDPDQINNSNTEIEIEGTKYRLCNEDLFPKNFIINLSAPSNYIGPNVLWGIPSLYDENDSNELEFKELPIIEHINDGFPSRKKNSAPRSKDDLPESLVEAIKYFFVSTAIRRSRGQNKAHCSMLINVSQYICWQDSIASFVQIIVQEFADKLGALNDNPEFEKELKLIFDNKIIPTNKAICKDHKDWSCLLSMPSWSKIRKELPIVAAKVRSEVRVLHSGTEEDGLNMTKLNYDQYENRANDIDNGLYVIAVGGNTMARGITLEGLLVSYFFRTTHTFDALMQMGRWFGYRDGYIDLCRLYLEKDMSINFRNIAVATQEMRNDFDEMFERCIKPKDFGLKVKTYPGVLEVTSRNKFGSAIRGELSLNRTTLQAYQIFKSKKKIEDNFSTITSFLNLLGKPSKKTRNGKKLPHLIWNCKSDQIIDFIKNFETATVRMPSNLVTSYIEAQNNIGNLINWTVALINVQRGKSRKILLNIDDEEYTIGASKRENEASDANIIYQAANSAIIGPSHESIDLSDIQYNASLEKSKHAWKIATANNQTKAKEPTYPYPTYAKQERDPKTGLLLLFYLDFGDSVDHIFSYALSMPEIKNDNNLSVSYEYVGQPIAFDSDYDPKTIFVEVDRDE